MHRVAEAFCSELTIPFLHIADPTGTRIVEAGLKRIALLGTKPVMSSAYMREYYEQKFGLEVLVPSEEDIPLIHSVIFNELVRGEVREESRHEYLRVCSALQQQGAQGVVLGCSEIFMLLRQEDCPQLPLFDTTALHVEAIVNYALSEEP